ncbi:cytochrome c oxidase subunit II [Pedomonas mirosovicensis]|uniref:cytochrome c oxidase subunit II n=1 Tax=Pedomonas mirosovicensis TaxID=2908641 RepID=UPI002166FD4A|nr:cytochrome c oxidase subunit II [Pedomonas mirosovicensis]MCH8684355.1 cytochrome c oxidase subunit II [Pedomonas mirosovicensis]
MRKITSTVQMLAAGAAVTWSAGAQATESVAGQPVPEALGLQAPVTEIGEFGNWMYNDWLFPIIAAITVFVTVLLVWVMVRYRASANPEPSKTSHNTLIEVIWTVVPVLILVAIAIPSFKLLYSEYTPPKADLTIKVTGHQWYWSYEYPDHDGLSFDSIMLTDEDAAKANLPRLLATDNRVVVPVGKTVKLLLTSTDVIHSWTIPSFFVKMDAVPGRINETWFKAEKPGIYYGQCSELCGIRHGFMPIMVEVVSEEQFAAWLEEAKAQFASASASTQFASADLTVRQ